MAEPDWTRPHWTRAAEKAMLQYFVFGTFPAEVQLDLSADASSGLPAGIEMRRIPKSTLAHWEGHPLRGALGDLLREDNPEAFDAARTAPDCLMLRGELADSGSLDYLRDTLGVLAAMLDAGGVAVVDPQILDMFAAAEWRTRYAGAACAEPRNHVLITCHDDEVATASIRTRGMRKFARPDVGIRHVPQAEVQRAGAVAARLVELEARGMRFGDGSTIAADGLPEDLRVVNAGSLDDPEFNNRHIEVTWPRS